MSLDLARRRVWWWAVFAVVVGVVAGLTVDHHRRIGAVTRLIGAAPCTAGASADSFAGLVVDPGRLGVGGTLERRDEAAVKGPWTVVVRRPDGSLGVHGAVVTFPVEAPPLGRRVDVNGAAGGAADGLVVWPLAYAHARVRGDLSEPELLAIAAATSVVDGKPVVRPIDGLNTVFSAPYKPVSVNEVRYGSPTVGEDETLGGGLTYTGVVSGGGFEDQLYAQSARPGGVVHCKPAMVSSVFGGNGTLAWEPAPGTVAYVGYSGAPISDEAVAALRRVAQRCRVLSAAEWRDLRPSVLFQPNEVS